MTNLKSKTREWLKEKYKAVVCNVEYFNSYSRKKIDLLNLFDTLAIFNHGLYGIQITDSNHLADHHKKLIENKNLHLWLDTENFAWLVYWSKKKIKRGGKAFKYEPKIREYYLMDYREVKNMPHSKLRVNNQVVIWEEVKI